MSKGGGLGVPKGLDTFFQNFYHFRLSKSAGTWKICQMSKTFLEANNIKIYAVLLDFAKFCDSRIKSAPRVPKIEGGGRLHSPNGVVWTVQMYETYSSKWTTIQWTAYVTSILTV